MGMMLMSDEPMPMADASTSVSSTNPTPLSFPDYPIPPDTENSLYILGSGYGLLLVDARNAFNELNRYTIPQPLPYTE